MGFTWKACFVADGHVPDPPTSITYASVVSRDSIRIALLIVALNDLYILATDVGNAYINADTKEKAYFIAGKKFGERQRTNSCHSKSFVWPQIKCCGLESAHL